MTPSMPFVALNPVVSDHPRLGGADEEGGPACPVRFGHPALVDSVRSLQLVA